jgi:hypothetical protein
MAGLTRLILVVVLSVALASCIGVQKSKSERGDDTSAPREYRTLYHELATKLSDLRGRMRPQWEAKNADSDFGVELLVSNSNRGEILLTNRVLEATKLTLDRLKELGVRSIALSIQTPILTRSYPRSAEYRRFYRRVAQEVRRRGYVLIVEMGTVFREPEFSKMRVDYSGLRIDDFNAQLREMAEAIIEDLQPDYLTILSEPDTQERNTGLDFSVSSFAGSIRHVVEGLRHPGVRLGAGAGTWNHMDYFIALAEIPELDYIDMHIYPIHHDFVLDRVIEVARIARNRRKGVSIGEAWLYKVSKRELARISPLEAFSRDVYSFWQPLDEAFLEVIVNVSHHIGVEFCSFFWMKYLYGYLPYDAKTRTLRPQQLFNQSDVVAGRQILEGRLNRTGEKLKMLIASDP